VVMDHLKQIVEAAGSTMDHLLKVNVWLKSQSDAPVFDRVYRRYFSSQQTLPARTRLQAGGMPMDCGLEVEAIDTYPSVPRTRNRTWNCVRPAAPVRCFRIEVCWSQ
jgi:2-iminobutanoate/2-iminopropanoate deaminase